MVVDQEPLDLFSLYQLVLDEEGEFWNMVDPEVLEQAQTKATKQLIGSYSVDGLKRPNSLDFNRLELRCAYLHLYATSHSHMVLYSLIRYRHQSGCLHLIDLMDSARNRGTTFNLTSLGGGPGSDPVGFLAYLARYRLLDTSPLLKVTVVDAYSNWESPFHNLMTRFYGSHILRSDFVVQNLLGPLRPEVTWNLRETHFLSMLKFLSAIAGNEEGTKQLLATIFGLLPVGALVLVIDNSGGKAFKHALESGRQEGLRPVFGPVCHLDFHVSKVLEPHLDQSRFGIRAQTHCTISLMILRKEEPPHFNHNLNINNYLSIHRTGMRFASANRTVMHPYHRRYSSRAAENRYLPGVHYSQKRDVAFAGLFAGAQDFARNISNSFGAYGNTVPRLNQNSAFYRPQWTCHLAPL